jgi:hypothetical protein
MQVRIPIGMDILEHTGQDPEVGPLGICFGRLGQVFRNRTQRLDLNVER